MGLVDQLFPAGCLLDEAVAYASKIAKMPPLALEYIKIAVDQGSQMDLDRGLLLESSLFAHLYGTEDQTEAMNAFLEKREHKPFQGK